MAQAKTKRLHRPGILKLILRFLKLLFILYFGITILWVLLYRFVNPPITLLMIERGFERKSAGKDWKIDHQWVDFDDIADPMKRAAVAAEDQRFLDHYGFDFKAMEKAIDKNAKSHKLIGGSTISQQTAKNVFLWPGRDYTRKIFEAYFTVLEEIFWGKKRIMEVYLNEIEMGDGIYGVQAASQAYFHKDAKPATMVGYQPEWLLAAPPVSDIEKHEKVRPAGFLSRDSLLPIWI